MLAKNSLTTNNRMQNTCDEHEAILNAITDKNYEACYHAVQKHLLSTKELSLLVLKDSK
jgi:DNA-binding GntR family transcriptional regulator